MLSDADFQLWLQDAAPAEKCVLVELEHSDGVLRLASRPYQTHPTDEPPSAPYDDWLTDLPELLSMADAGMGAGDLEFVCPGLASDLMSKHWRGRAARVYLGAEHWPLADFRLLVAGLTESVTRPARDRIRVEFADYGVLLTRQVQTAQENDITLPVCFGKVFNVAPVLLDPLTLVYAVHDGPVESLTVRDNGVTVSITPDLDNGRFQLDQAPVGEITAEVEQAASTPAALLAALAARIGVADGGVIHLPNAALTVGYYCGGGETYQDVLKALATSIGGVGGFNAAGALGLVCLAHAGEPVMTLTEDDIAEGEISLSSELPELSRLTLRYRHNTAVPGTVAGSVMDQQPVLAAALATEWSELSADNPDNHYPELWRQEAVIETLLTDPTGAAAELERFSAWRFQRHFIYQITAFMRAVGLVKGDRVRVIHPAWGLDHVGTVLDSEQRPGSNRIELEIVF